MGIGNGSDADADDHDDNIDNKKKMMIKKGIKLMVNDKWGQIQNFETQSCFSLGTTLGGRRDSLQTLQDRPPQKCTKSEKYECVCFLLSFWSIGDSL